ncbi:hypothetical protein J7E50_18235 [Pedobacter sp. ISL-68]|uniref:hypothetical protein n=1 Tax=unclassified Pedobacter TaxID=2628915 RepID=UPI001BE8DE54|nr:MULTISPECIES: hypothetical protein [unclassified Pedobacter]MBT2559862.1 hypothetical protein [Pedobacter sp. ISL-64]MBT2592167.1 hypothetical protein [Pedobacter sp. ISL-68]
MKIGIIKYRKYEELVLLDGSFITEDLFKIIFSDPDYVKFQIVDEKENLLLSTHYNETGEGVEFLNVVKVTREVEILGTTYDAYKTPSMVHKTKVTWKAVLSEFKTKKGAQKYADRINLKAKMLIEKFIYKTNHQHENN